MGMLSIGNWVWRERWWREVKRKAEGAGLVDERNEVRDMT